MIHLTFMMVCRGYRGVNASRTIEQAVIIIDLARQLFRRHSDSRSHGIRLDQVRQRFLSIIGPDGSTSSIEVSFFYFSVVFSGRANT